MNLNKFLQQMRGLFSLSAPKAPSTILSLSETDVFADQVLLELKAVSNQAISVALQNREGRFMRSILEESFFSLESLVIEAVDAQSAKELDDFLSHHEAVSPDFRKRFFQQVLQSEYRSTRGASVRVEESLLPILEVAPNLMNAATEDESFIATVKGRKIRFFATATLNGPHKKNRAVSVETPSSTVPSSHSASHTGNSTPIDLVLHDRQGRTQQVLSLPAVLGRDVSDTPTSTSTRYSTAQIDATYVSRRQLLVFELLGEVYCLVPKGASLTCSTSAGQVLKPDTIYPLPMVGALILTAGVPTDTLEPPERRESTNDYPIIELSISNIPHHPSQSTPRPRAIK